MFNNKHFSKGGFMKIKNIITMMAVSLFAITSQVSGALTGTVKNIDPFTGTATIATKKGVEKTVNLQGVTDLRVGTQATLTKVGKGNTFEVSKGTLNGSILLYGLGRGPDGKLIPGPDGRLKLSVMTVFKDRGTTSSMGSYSVPININPSIEATDVIMNYNKNAKDQFKVTKIIK